MKAFIITEKDLITLRAMVESRGIHLLENGTVDEHRTQAREQYTALVVRWIERVTE